MNKNQSLIAQFALLAACVAYGFYMSGKLPEIVPTHWNIQGKIDGYGSKNIALWMMPGVIILNLVLTKALPALSPEKFEVDRFGKTFGFVMFLVSLMMAALQYVILDMTVKGTHATAGSSVDIGKALMVVIFLFFAAMGNVMGKIKRNFYMGIRTPWTLADERVWDKTHREAGHLWFLGGLVGAAVAALGAPIYISIAFLLLISLLPVVRSYQWYQKLNPPGSRPTDLPPSEAS